MEIMVTVDKFTWEAMETVSVIQRLFFRFSVV